MRRNLVIIASIILVLSLIGVFTYMNQGTSSSSTAESIQTTEETETSSELNIRISDDKPAQALIIGEDGELLSESEIEESLADKKEWLQEQQALQEREASQVEESTSNYSDEAVSSEEMRKVTENVEAYTKKQALATFRETAKTEVAKYKAEGIEAFQNITDEMIDAYSEEELNELMVLIYQNIKY